MSLSVFLLVISSSALSDPDSQPRKQEEQQHEPDDQGHDSLNRRRQRDHVQNERDDPDHNGQDQQRYQKAHEPAPAETELRMRHDYFSESGHASGSRAVDIVRAFGYPFLVG